MDVSQIADRLADYQRELSEEHRQVWVGLKSTSDSAAIEARYADLFTRERAQEAATALQTATDPTDRDRRNRVVNALEGGYLSGALAEQSDALQNRLLQASATVDGEQVGYFQLQPTYTKEPDHDRRERLYDAFVAINREVVPEQRQLMQRALELLRDDLAAPSYVNYLESRKQFSYQPFLERLRGLRTALQPLYQRAMGERSQTVLGRPLGSSRSVHASYLMQYPELDAHFPAQALTPALEKTLTALGMPLDQLTNITIDAENRPNKNPRAVCFVVDPPENVHLVIKPIGGMYDYEAFFHEAGHALHYGHLDPSLLVEYSRLGTSYALTEVYSYLFEHLLYDPAFLRWWGLPEEVATEVARKARLSNLFMLMRYIGKLEYELAYYEAPTDWERARKLYTDSLTSATQFDYEPDHFLYDMDWALYAADYLRAWVTQAQLTEYLQRTYGSEWFATAEAGELLRDLWRQGDQPENEDIAQQIGAIPHDTSALQRFYEELLAQ